MNKQEFLRTLKEDEEFRHAVAGLIGYEELLEGQKEIRKEIRRLWKKTEEHSKNIERHSKNIERLWQEVKGLREEQNRMNRKLDALGARWGIMSEAAFRETIRELLRDMGKKVEKWVEKDSEGYVFGYPSSIDVDILIKNGKTVVMEITSHARESDIAILKRKAEFYEKTTGKKVDEIVISSPYVDEKAREAARRLGIKVYSET